MTCGTAVLLYMPSTAGDPFSMSHRPATRVVASDRELVALVADGDAAALRHLYERYSPTLCAVAYRILGERADADDVVVEAFTQAWDQAPRFDPSRGSVAVWLTMIARSRALDLSRARRRRDRASDDVARDFPGRSPTMGTVQDDPSFAAEQSERRQHVKRALGALSPDQRTAIELAYYEGLSQSEIAARLNEPLGTVKTRIRTGMQKLRDALRPLYADRLR